MSFRMELLPDTHNCGLCMRRDCRERFPRHSWSAVLTCITARASRMCCDTYRDRQIMVSFEVDGGENVPSIPGACETCKCTYLVRAHGRDFVTLFRDNATSANCPVCGQLDNIPTNANCYFEKREAEYGVIIATIFEVSHVGVSRYSGLETTRSRKCDGQNEIKISLYCFKDYAHILIPQCVNEQIIIMMHKQDLIVWLLVCRCYPAIPQAQGHAGSRFNM